MPGTTTLAGLAMPKHYPPLFNGSRVGYCVTGTQPELLRGGQGFLAVGQALGEDTVRQIICVKAGRGLTSPRP